MGVIRIELSARRAWWWAALVVIAWLLICLLVADRWARSWPDAAVWVGLPVVYVGAVIAAASADLVQVRQASGLTSMALAGARPRGLVGLLHLMSTWSICVLVPAATALALVIVVGWSGGASGTWTSGYLVNAVLHATVVFALGRLIGSWVKSAVFAPVLALVFGLAAGLYLSPVPPSNHPWDMPSPGYTAVLGLAAFALVVASALAGVGFLSSLARARSSNVLSASAAAMLIAGVGAAAVAMGLPVKAPRTPVGQECGTTESGTEVCVWPDHREFLAPLLTQAERFDEVVSGLSWASQRWSVREPGLRSSSSDTTSVVVRPLQLGPGLWLTAEEFAFALTPHCPTVANMSAAEISDLQVITLSNLGVMTSYIYGDTRPSEVLLSGGSDEHAQASKVVAEVAQMSRAEQRQWLISSFTDNWERCQ